MEEGLPRNLQGILRAARSGTGRNSARANAPLHVPLKLENTAVVMDDGADSGKGPIMKYGV